MVRRETPPRVACEAGIGTSGSMLAFVVPCPYGVSA